MSKPAVFVKVNRAKIEKKTLVQKPRYNATVRPSHNNVAPKKRVNNSTKSAISVKAKTFVINSGYKYQGKGFEVFTGYRNKSKPIYAATMLYCTETCRQNSEMLRAYLIEHGKFKDEMIEEIVFKEGYYSAPYALIKVRAPLKYIKNKMQTLNKAKGHENRGKKYNVIRIFKRTKNLSANPRVNNVLYVNNFDILNKETHKRFTKLFCKFGELIKDIKMGIDRNSDPYAIIHFRHCHDAKNCVQAEDIRFGGKSLSINYSKIL